MTLTFLCYKDKKKEWRWYLKAANDRTIADSGEGYINLQDCLDAIELIQRGAAAAIILDGSQDPAALIRIGVGP